MAAQILVLGASGNIGGHLARNLVKAGFSVKTASRRGAFSVAGAESVLFDLQSPETFASALAQVGSAYLLMPVGHLDARRLMMPFLEALVERQIKIVFLAGMGVEAYKQSAQRDIEDWLKTSGANFVILRPNWFMDNFHTFWHEKIMHEGVVTVPAADHKISFIDVRDIADVAARVLTRHQWDGMTLVLTGPESLYYRQATRLISRQVGRPVIPVLVKLDDYIDSLIETGLPKAYAERFGEFYEVAINGFNAEVTGTVESVTGYKARSFADYAAQYFGER